jgi:hypothetical protein
MWEYVGVNEIGLEILNNKWAAQTSAVCASPYYNTEPGSDSI